MINFYHLLVWFIELKVSLAIFMWISCKIFHWCNWNHIHVGFNRMRELLDLDFPLILPHNAACPGWWKMYCLYILLHSYSTNSANIVGQVPHIRQKCLVMGFCLVATLQGSLVEWICQGNGPTHSPWNFLLMNATCLAGWYNQRYCCSGILMSIWH